MQLKSIIQGRLEFGSEKTFGRMLSMYQYRIDNFYKSDVLFNEDVFDPDTNSINLTRLIAMVPEKYWNNTVKLLEYLAQFALSGSVGAWLVNEGKILKYARIEPRSEKAIVQDYIRGQKLAGEEGKEQEALESLTKVINAHDQHAQAYERRGYVNFMLEDMSGAIYDFTKCLRIDPNIPEAYYWRATAHYRKGEPEKAIDDFEMTTKKAIALQPIYWKARFQKAHCHIDRKEYDLAARELKLFIRRKYETDNPNYEKVPLACLRYAEVLFAQDQADEALEAVEKGLNHGSEAAPDLVQKLLTLRGRIKQDIGEDGHADWKKAAEMGSTEAEKLLAKFEA